MHHKVLASMAFHVAFILSFLSAEEGAAVAGTNGSDAVNPPDDVAVPGKAYLVAAGETVLSDVFVYSVDRYLGDAGFARISPKTWEDNLRGAWDWDQSDFQTNQIMHPYHGYSYFAAGRTNGLDFYESTLLASGGSAIWELFGERDSPSVNDLLETTLGGACFGEMFHRLYVEASGGLLSFLVSPVDSLNGALTRRPAERPTGAIRELSFQTGFGYAGARRFQDGEELDGDTLRTAAVNYELSCVYGDPFSQCTAIPFEQFELTLICGGGYQWHDVTILSDGYLVALSPADSATHRSTAGLTFGYNVLWTQDVQFAANALDLAYKSQRNISPGISLEQRYYAGAVLFGATTFYALESDGTTRMDDTIDDYCYGMEAKTMLSLANARNGSVLCLSARWYGMRTIPGTVDNSEGRVICQRYAAEYTFPVSRKLSIRFCDVYTQENGWYKYVPDVKKASNEATIGVAIDLQQGG